MQTDTYSVEFEIEVTVIGTKEPGAGWEFEVEKPNEDELVSLADEQAESDWIDGKTRYKEMQR